MTITLKAVPQWIAPIGGLIYFALWIVAEAGRAGLAENAVMFAAFGLTICVALWRPLVSLALIVVVPGLQLLGVVEGPESTTWPTYLAVALTGFAAGLNGGSVIRWVALLFGALSSTLIALLMSGRGRSGGWSSWIGMSEYGTALGDFILIGLAAFGLYVGAWAIGIAYTQGFRRGLIGKTLASTERKFAEADFELRLAQDRARISRDVHDALAHSLAVIVSQAQGAVALHDARPEVARRSLENIAAVGRSALIDVRRLVERIQDDADVAEPTATIRELHAIVAELRDTGMDVTLRTLGEPRPIGPPQELTVFRLVQESLTNALKHAGPTSTVDAVLDWRGPGLAILVTSRGEEPLVEQGDVRGVGIDGMKERARLAGGWLTAEASDDETFIVSAFIPTRETPAVAATTEPADEPDETEELARV